LVQELLNLKKTEVYVPIFNPDTNSITPTKIDDNTEFCNDQFNIPTPETKNIEEVEANIESDIELDYIVIPLVAFDLNGHRLGHGRGVYDRFLKTLINTPIKVGFGYEIQLTEKLIPVDKNDVKLDYCVTEERIFRFSR